jgi:2-amino-4-hydroxy-6-hydroxymethyldihydropteridine diphosphokinase
MNKAYLLLGSNEGDRMQWLQQALEQINEHCGEIRQQSHIYETAAWGIEEQPDFLNLAICIHTTLSAQDLLAGIRAIENQLGRQRKLKWGQRTLDIDILFFDNEIIDTEELELPHPFIQERRFALVPMNELAADLLHPVLHKTISELLHECPDKLEVKRI